MREISGLWLVILAALLIVDSARAQRPSSTPRVNDGRYRGANDGRYVPDDSGRYVHVGDGSRGLYQGGGGQYTGTGGRLASDRFRVTPISPSAPAVTTPRVLVSAPTRPAPPPPPPPPPTPPPSPPPSTRAPVLAQLRVASDGRSNGGWQTLRHENEVTADGYHYLFETENGILAEESGRVEREDEGLKSQGFYQYTGDDGQVYRVDYVAGVDGFVARGDHIPKIPPEIEKLLAYLAAHPQST